MKRIEINEFLIELKDELQLRMRRNKVIPSLISKSQAFENWMQLEIVDFLISKDYAKAAELQLERKLAGIGDERGFDLYQKGKFAIEIKTIKSGWSDLLKKDRGDFYKLSKLKETDTKKIFLYFFYPANEKRDYLIEKRKMLIEDGIKKRIQEPKHDPQNLIIGGQEIFMDALLFK